MGKLVDFILFTINCFIFKRPAFLIEDKIVKIWFVAIILFFRYFYLDLNKDIIFKTH